MTSIEQKQQFLYKQIIQTGLDPESFQLFLQQKRPNGGLDISIWQLQELQKVVEQFKIRQLNKKIGKNQEKNISKSNNQIKKIKQQKKQIEKKRGSPTKSMSQQSPNQQKNQTSSQKKKKSQIVKHDSHQYQFRQLKPTSVYEQQKKINRKYPEQFLDKRIDFQTNTEVYQKYINCQRTIINNIFTKNDIKIQIKGFQKVQGGFFQQNYIVYNIHTINQNWKVKRRYNDFMWLRQQLQRLHPGFPIPPIAKKGGFRKYDEKHIIRRMIILQNFLNKVVEIPQIGCQKVFENFLKISDQIQYLKSKNIKDEPDRFKFENLNNLKGKINLIIEPKISKLFNEIKQNILINEPLLKKIYKDSKLVAYKLQQIAHILSQMSPNLQILANQSKSFNKLTQLEGKYESCLLFNLIGNVTKIWSEFILKQSEFIKKYFYGIYKYQYNTQISFLQYLSKINLAKEQYQEFSSKLIKIKQKLFEQKNISKWNLSTVEFQKIKSAKDNISKTQAFNVMLPKQSEQEIKLKQYYALINFRCYEELSRYYNKNSKYLGNKLQQFTNNIRITSNQKMMMWADLSTQILSFKQGKKIIGFEIMNEVKKLKPI